MMHWLSLEQIFSDVPLIVADIARNETCFSSHRCYLDETMDAASLTFLYEEPKSNIQEVLVHFDL